jgi:DNA-binding transcriptional LysR family regulator
MFSRLSHFLLVVQTGTFTEAARRAHVSQPALSASIRRLEEELDARLLHRDRRGATPTAAGEALLPRARAALAAVEDGRRAVAEVMGLHAGTVRLGAGPTACTYLLPVHLAGFRRDHPKVHYFLREAHNPDVWRALIAGDLDLGLVPSTSRPPDGGAYEADPCLADEVLVVTAPDTDPTTAAWVTFPRGSTTRGLLEQHFPGEEVVMELGSIAAVKGNVRAGIGKCLVSRSAVGRDLAQGLLVEVPDPRTPIPRSFVLAHRGAERLPPAAAALRERLLAVDAGPKAGAASGRI